MTHVNYTSGIQQIHVTLFVSSGTQRNNTLQHTATNRNTLQHAATVTCCNMTHTGGIQQIRVRSIAGSVRLLKV